MTICIKDSVKLKFNSIQWCRKSKRKDNCITPLCKKKENGTPLCKRKENGTPLCNRKKKNGTSLCKRKKEWYTYV